MAMTVPQPGLRPPKRVTHCLEEARMVLFMGDDWAEAHHDVHLVNEAGRAARRRCPGGTRRQWSFP